MVFRLSPQPWLSLLAALAVALAVAQLGCVEQTGPVLIDTPKPPVPDPLTPLPSPAQLAWQTQELSAFFHFGINTFTDREQGDGTDSPAVFNPTALDPMQWMSTLQGAGFRRAMLTAKHRDGFCLWPTKCTTYSVAASSWMGGQGDVVRQFVDAAHQAGIRVGLALYPSDRHEPTFGTPAYLNVFHCLLTELLTNYGTVDEIWLWGQPGPQPAFNWNDIRNLVHQLQPQTLLDVGNFVAVAGADVRSTAQAVPVAPSDQSSVQPNPAAPMQGTTIWYPAEAAFRTRPGWFWHPADEGRLASLTQLIDMYYDSVGRNSVLLLNQSPDKRGLLADVDVAAMGQFGAAIRAIYQSNVVAARPGTADSVFKDAPAYTAAMAVDGRLDTYWAAAAGSTTARLEFELGGARMFNVISIQEPIPIGERITQHRVEAKVNGAWTTIASGTVVGQRKLHRVGAISATAIALVITRARGVPAVAELGAYLSPHP